jgi:glycosyltransferase involved in cell wall biosynthesis
LQQEGNTVRFALRVAGSFVTGEEQREYERWMDSSVDAGLHRYLGFLGPEQKAQALRDADVFCFPTYYGNEGQPVNLIEAMAFGLPIVTTRWRSIPEMLPKDYLGFAEPKDPISVAVALRRVLVEVQGNELRGIWLQHFTLDRYLSQVSAAVCSVGLRGTCP